MTPFIITIPSSRAANNIFHSLKKARKQVYGWHQRNIKLPNSDHFLYCMSNNTDNNWTFCSVRPLTGLCAGLTSWISALSLPNFCPPIQTAPIGTPHQRLIICNPQMGFIPSYVHHWLAKRECEELCKKRGMQSQEQIALCTWGVLQSLIGDFSFTTGSTLPYLLLQQRDWCQKCRILHPEGRAVVWDPKVI